MKQIFIFFILNSVLIPFFFTESVQNDLKQAEFLFQDGLYDEVLPLYEKLRMEKEDPILDLRVVECLLESEKPEQALAEIDRTEKTPSALYLKQSALKKMGQPEEALSCLDALLLLSLSTEEKNLALIEKGILLETTKQYAEAECFYKNILPDLKDPLFRGLVHLQLTKLQIKKENLKEALLSLSKVPEIPTLEAPSIFLEAVLHLLEKKYEQAFFSFQKIKDPSYRVCALKGLICTQLKQLSSSQEQKKLLKNAEKWMCELKDLCPSDPLLLDFYLIKSQRLQDEKSYTQAKQFVSENAKEDSFLLKCIRAHPSRDERKKEYLSLIHTATVPIKTRIEAAFFWGTEENTFNKQQEAFLLGAELAKENSPSFFKLFQKKLAILDGMQGNYTQALKRLTSFPQDEDFFLIQGTLYLKMHEHQKAEETFRLFLETFPHSMKRTKGWMGLARCAELASNIPLKKQILKQIYENYPSSPEAPTAYFSYYSLPEYAGEGKEALKHLQQMETKFPANEWSPFSYYLIGLRQLKHQKDLTKAIDFFQRAENKVEEHLQKGSCSPFQMEMLQELKLQAQVERGKSLLEIGKTSQRGKRKIFLSYAEELFEQLSKDYPLSPDIRYYLIKSCIYQDKQQKGLLLLENLSSFFSSQETFFLFKLCMQKGKIEQQLNHFSEAAKSYEKASQIFGISSEQQLKAWIKEGLCFQSLKEYEKAMTLFSQVINQNVVSPRRIDAMFLRADLYEIQGRHALAIKQWEAIAKKGGDRAQEAKIKLTKK